MNTVYCSTCGKANLFEVERPQFCAKCGNVINKAFASVAPKSAEQPRQIIPPYNDPHQHPANRRRQERHTQPDEDEGDYVDHYQKEALVRELAASISAADFGISINDEADDKSVKLGPILQQALANQPTKSGNKPRKARK